jgi:hypothetical protein
VPLTGFAVAAPPVIRTIDAAAAIMRILAFCHDLFSFAGFPA